MTSSHSFHSLEAEKGPISFTFRHTHTGMVGTKSPPGLQPAITVFTEHLTQPNLSLSVYKRSVQKEPPRKIPFYECRRDAKENSLSHRLAVGCEPRPLVWEVDTLSSRPQAEAQATVVQGREADWEQLLEQVLGYSSCSGSRHEWGWSRGCGI